MELAANSKSQLKCKNTQIVNFIHSSVCFIIFSSPPNGTAFPQNVLEMDNVVSCTLSTLFTFSVCVLRINFLSSFQHINHLM